MAVKLYANVHVLEVGDVAPVDFEDGYDLYDARYVLKGGDTLTGALLIHGGTDTLQLKVKGHSSQSASLQEWQSSGGAVLAKVASDGTLTIGSNGDARTRVGPSPDADDGYHYNLRYAGSEATGGLMKQYISETHAESGRTLYGVNTVVDLGVNSSYTASNMTGQQFFLTKVGAGEISYIFGNRERVEVAGGIANNVFALHVQMDATNSAYMSNAYGVYVTASRGGAATIYNLYGVYVEDMNLGDTVGYAIFTGRGDVRLMSNAADKLGFHGATPVAQQTVTGSRGGNAALASLLSKLENLGLVVDGSS